MAKIVVGLSGGVDSAVAALLLKREGWEVHGVFMQNWEEEDCPSRQDLLDCAAVCDVLGIELEAVNFAAEYRQKVFANFLQEYEAGRTPNPDVLCNSEIKFDCLLEYAKQLGSACLATGHYAQLRELRGQWQLLKAEDSTKDQSYFLYRLNQQQLSRVKFPIGAMLKREVREIARAAGLPNYDRKDSTGICFIGERPFREFLQRFLMPKPGEIRTHDGRPIGEHQGVMFYTLGQRQGLGIGGSREGSEPWYVVGKDAAANILYVAQGHHHPALQRSDARLHQLSWVGAMPKTHWVYTAKVRYRQQDAPCELADLENDQCVVNFATPQRAITPGQSAVIYESRVCLGGGILMEAPRAPAQDFRVRCFAG